MTTLYRPGATPSPGLPVEVISNEPSALGKPIVGNSRVPFAPAVSKGIVWTAPPCSGWPPASNTLPRTGTGLAAGGAGGGGEKLQPASAETANNRHHREYM